MGSVLHTFTNTIILLTCGLTILYTVYVHNTILFISFERTILHKYCYHKQHYIKSKSYDTTNYTAQLYLQCNSTTSTQYSFILIWIVNNNNNNNNNRKHSTNDARCQELGWVCIPLAVETFGHWGKEAQNVFSRLASLLSIHQGRSKSVALFDIYSRMNMVLVRSISRAIMGRVVVL